MNFNDEVTRLLAAGYLLAELSGRAEPGPDDLARHSTYPALNAQNNLSGKYKGMLAIRIGKTWSEDPEQTARVEELLAGCNAPKVTIPGHSETWLLRSERPFRSVRTTFTPVQQYGFTVHAADCWGVLLPPSKLMTTRHGLAEVIWSDPENIVPVDAPDALLRVLDNNGLINGGLFAS